MGNCHRMRLWAESAFGHVCRLHFADGWHWPARRICPDHGVGQGSGRANGRHHLRNFWFGYGRLGQRADREVVDRKAPPDDPVGKRFREVPGRLFRAYCGKRSEICSDRASTYRIFLDRNRHGLWDADFKGSRDDRYGVPGICRCDFCRGDHPQ